MIGQKVQRRISLLVPLYGDDPHRKADWAWLSKYWADQIPGVEIVIGRDRTTRPWWAPWTRRPFSKTRAINAAFRKSHGDIICVLDSDAYIDGAVIEHCARRLRAARKAGAHTFFVPYKHLFRLTQAATQLVLGSAPSDPYRFTDPPPDHDIEPKSRHAAPYGREYGAMCIVMPREAFEEVARADPAFRGWGGEDVCLVMALETLWGKVKYMPDMMLHLWHPIFEDPGIALGMTHSTVLRAWDDQEDDSEPNVELADRYYRAKENPRRMRRLVEGHRRWWWRFQRKVK